MTGAINLRKLKEDGKVYIPGEDYNQFEKVLKSKGVKFFAFDMDDEVLIELDIEEGEA